MTTVVETADRPALRADACRVVNHLTAGDYPFDYLVRYPISSIETISARRGKRMHGACAVGCLACCANAVNPRDSHGGLAFLSRTTFQAFLEVLQVLSLRGIDILSTGRLNLFGASSELDHPDAVALRRMLSTYIAFRYGVPLGHFSSDLVFHVSEGREFLQNLRCLVPDGTLWDNICVAIDEQAYFPDAASYEHYLFRLAEVWRILAPALRSEIPHAKPDRATQPRVILNMLVPGDGSTFLPRFRALYPGGPKRAVAHQDLIERYVRPFVGCLREEMRVRPSGHHYTTGIFRLSGLAGSRVYVSAGRYAPFGRARMAIDFPARTRAPQTVLKTKLLPISEEQLQIRVVRTSGTSAEDETAAPRESWCRTINQTAIDFRAMLPR